MCVSSCLICFIHVFIIISCFCWSLLCLVADIYIYIYIVIYYLVFFVTAAACDFIKTCPLGRALTMEDRWLERRTATARTTERGRNHRIYGNKNDIGSRINNSGSSTSSHTYIYIYIFLFFFLFFAFAAVVSSPRPPVIPLRDAPGDRHSRRRIGGWSEDRARLEPPIVIAMVILIVIIIVVAVIVIAVACEYS